MSKPRGSEASAGPVALVGLSVWDGVAEGPDPRPQTIRIEGERIAAVGPEPELAAGARVVRLDGATALPGLIDAHVHMTLDPAIPRPLDQLAVPRETLVAAMQRRASAMLYAGITTARDLGGGDWLELELRDRIARNEIAGPRLVCAGQPLTSPGGHCHFWGGEARTPEELRSVLRRQVEHGVDWIKVMATGGVLTKGTSIRQAQFDAPTLEAVVVEARAHGRSVAAHCHGTDGIRNAASARVASIEHCSFAGEQGFGTDFDRDVADCIAAAETWVSPTVNAGWARRSRTDGSRSRFGERMSAVFSELRAAGCRFIASTDAGIPNVQHHRLAEGLQAFAALTGLSAVEVLRTATSDAARALGLGEVTGALRPDLAADVLVVHGDPFADLEALRRPRLVVSRGRLFEPELLNLAQDH